METISDPKLKQTLNSMQVKSESKVQEVKSDIGVVVKRNEMENGAKKKPCNKSHWGLICQTVDHICDQKSFSNFIESESKLRKTDRKNSVTRILSQDQFKEFKKKFKWSSDLKMNQNKIKYWMVFPEFKGKKPKDWNIMLKEMLK